MGELYEAILSTGAEGEPTRLKIGHCDARRHVPAGLGYTTDTDPAGW